MYPPPDMTCMYTYRSHLKQAPSSGHGIHEIIICIKGPILLLRRRCCIKGASSASKGGGPAGPAVSRVRDDSLSRRVCVCVCDCVCDCVCACVCVYIGSRRGLFTHIYMYIYIYICMYVYIYICIYMYIYIYICIYIYMHTHTHTHTQHTHAQVRDAGHSRRRCSLRDDRRAQHAHLSDDGLRLR